MFSFLTKLFKPAKKNQKGKKSPSPPKVKFKVREVKIEGVKKK